MRPQKSLSASSDHSRGIQQDGAGLIALLIVLIAVVCGAAALLLTTPQALESTRSAVAAPRETASEPTFHERYRMNAVGEPVDAPSF